MNDNIKINEFIENGLLVTLKALKEYAMDIIKSENLEKLCTDVKGIEVTRTNMYYDMNEQIIGVNIDGCVSILKSNFCSYEYVNSLPSVIKRINYWNSLKSRTNIINMYLLYVINHELEHVRQFDSINKPTGDNNSRLLKITNNLIKLDRILYNGELYCFYHDKFLIEYQAIAKSGYKLINEISNNYKNVLSPEEIEFFNIYIAKRLLSGYNGVFDYKKAITTPIKHLVYISRRVAANAEDEIEELEANEILNNNVDDILIGRDVPNDVLNTLNDIAKGKVKTNNLFNRIYSQQKYYIQS